MNADAVIVIIACLFTSDVNNLPVEFCEINYALVLFARFLSLSNNISSIHSPYRKRLYAVCFET